MMLYQWLAAMDAGLRRVRLLDVDTVRLYVHGAVLQHVVTVSGCVCGSVLQNCPVATVAIASTQLATPSICSGRLTKPLPIDSMIETAYIMQNVCACLIHEHPAAILVCKPVEALTAVGCHSTVSDTGSAIRAVHMPQQPSSMYM